MYCLCDGFGHVNRTLDGQWVKACQRFLIGEISVKGYKT